MGQADQGLAGSQDQHRVIPRTLTFITHGEDVLLLRGGPGKRLWAGLYNGVGGHVEASEDVYTSALREISEETGLAVQQVKLRSVIQIDAGQPGLGVMIFVFTAVAVTRAVSPSLEGALEWAPRASLPWAEMVEDLPTLLPRVLSMGGSDPPFFAFYCYDKAGRLQVRFAPEDAHELDCHVPLMRENIL